MSIVIVRSDGLNLREIPSNSGHIVDQLNPGDELAVIEKRTSKSGFEWLRVRCVRTNESGWVAGRFTAAKPEVCPKPVTPRPIRPFEDPIKPLPKPGWPKWFWALVIVAIVITLFWLLPRG